MYKQQPVFSNLLKKFPLQYKAYFLRRAIWKTCHWHKQLRTYGNYVDVFRTQQSIGMNTALT